MSMKVMPLTIFLVIVFFALILFAGFPVRPGQNPVVVKNEVILKKGQNDYMEVRHIVVHGTNQEIGRALGEIAQEYFGVTLEHYDSALTGRAHRQYIENNYPILRERMKGVAVSYGLDPGDDLYDTSYLGYGAGPAGCSMIFFPGTTTTSGHAMYFRNMDYFTVTGPELAENAPSAGRARMCSKNYVLEMYPDRGYPSLVIGSFDLLNAPLDGINAQGVTVSMLVDNDAAPVTVTDLNKAPGLSSFQLMRAVLDTAADTREAKAIIMNNTVSMLAVPLHALVADRSGRSFIAEMSDKDFQWHFTDNNNTPQILTNHAVYKYPTTGTFPDVLASDEYDSFNRYRKPDAYINRHLQKFSPEDAFFSMRLVYASTELAMEGGSRPLPMRTVWTSVLDLEDRSATVRFYLGDAGKDRPAGSPPLVFFGLLRFALME